VPVVAIRVLTLAVLGGASSVLLSATSLPLPLPRPSPVAQAASQAEELPPPRTVASTAVPSGTPPPAVASTLPGNLLIADRANNRVIEVTPDRRIVWEFPRPGDLAPGQHFRWPDDAFYSPDGRSIIVNEEESAAIVLVDYASHRIVWQYGVSERPGRSAGHLNGPDDAYMLRDGTVTVADIRNCRLLRIAPSTGTIVTQLGSGTCVHRPPFTFALPNGDTPLPNGHVLVTEISGSWVSEVSWQGGVLWSVRIPSVRYPSDAQLTRDGNILLVDYSRPGQVLKVAKDGTILWRYGPRSGPGMIDHPSLAIELSNGLIALNDDFRHRVVVIDPRTDRIVWQYGRTDRLGRTAGLLYVPDGIDIRPTSWGVATPFIRRSGKVPGPL
jgi:outer membrane protein assembly factor BamB